MKAYCHRFGRRGAYLFSMGLFYIFYGLGLTGEPRAVYRVFQAIMPMYWWAVVWAVVGLLSIVAAFVWWDAYHWVRLIAFAGLMFVASGWTVGFLGVYFLDSYVGVQTWSRAAVFGSLMATTAIVVGWHEPRDLR